MNWELAGGQLVYVGSGRSTSSGQLVVTVNYIDSGLSDDQLSMASDTGMKQLMNRVLIGRMNCQ